MYVKLNQAISNLVAKHFQMKLLNTNALLTIAAVLCFSVSAWSQRTVTGAVYDGDSDVPLIGADIIVPGTTTGTITDVDGQFSLDVPDGTEAIQISYVGYEEQLVPLTTSGPLTVRLRSGQTLDEVLVIGYGTVEKEDATGSVQAVGEEDFNQGAISSPQELLAGKIPGVQITSGGGAPGSGSNIRIRGGSSLSASNDPLIIVDGIPLANGEFSGSRNLLNAINPNDIETFTVLKDASATAIYGSRASNGVILITTKKGSVANKLRITYNAKASISQINDRIDMLSASDFRNLVIKQYGEGSPQASLLGSANTDWQDEIYENAFGHEHNLSFSGGIAEKVPYRLSFGYADRAGGVKTDKFNRITTALNLNPKFLDDHLQVNLSFKGAFNKNEFADNDAAISNAIRFDPTQPVTNGSEYGGYYTWLQTASNGDPITIATNNPVARLNQRTNEATGNRYIVNAQFDYRFHFLPSLRANLSLGSDYYDAEGDIDIPVNAGFEFARNMEGQLIGGKTEEYAQERKNKLLEFFLNYKEDLADNLEMELMGGYSWQHFWRENYTSAVRKGAPAVIFTEADFATREYYLLSLFGRANFALNDQFFLTGTIRRDGTSRFSEDNRWGLFPSVAFAWKILDNSARTLSGLKLRVGYGVTGQQDINENDFYPYLARYQFGQENAAYQFGDEFVKTIRPNGYDANIKWEETTTLNAGIDYSLLNDRIYGSLDVYQRETKDLINFIPVPVGTNLTNFINTNVGDLENQGIEFALNTVPVKNEKLTWNFGFNVASNKNKITRLTASDDASYLGVLTGGIAGAVGNQIQIHSVGHSAYSFFVFEQVYDEAGNPIEGLYVDRNNDGQINNLDKYHKENPNANVSFGINTSVQINKFSISTALRSQIGNYVYNNVLADAANYSKIYNSAGYLQNTHKDTEKINFNNPQYFSDMYVQNASFLRMDHITLGYDFGDLIGNRFTVNLSVQNPFVITKYEGLDPEIFVKNDKQGIDDNFYPRPTTYTLGLNLDF